MAAESFVTIDGTRVPIESERNLLELVRKAGVDLPTFCYHSELSVYGACRMCVVEVEKMGIVASCTVPPQPGMVVHTNTDKLRRIRKTIIELLLANHDRDCTTCPKNGSCKLQDLADRFGVSEVRFGQADRRFSLDSSTPAIVRDPNKCILCGDCVRACSEVQGIGILDFAYRGSKAMVMPAFGKQLADVDCVQCGQCTTVCPTGALTINSCTDQVWKAVYDPSKKVVAQVAPAVRVSLAEEFGHEPGEIVTGKIVSALKRIGFDYVFDTSFTADLTVFEEGAEFLDRLERGERLPQFTSCCPAWVKYVEQYAPEYVSNLSSCRSPQQMFGAVARHYLPSELGVKPEDIYVVSIMPCTAKKFEAQREEFAPGGRRDVDAVVTTHELARMIKEAGVDFERLEVEPFDVPLGMATGAGMIFGNTGGVAEAVLRAAAGILEPGSPAKLVFEGVRGTEGVREAELTLGGRTIRVAVAHSLGAAAEVLRRIRSGEAQYDIVEVMACPGGCIGGGGQPRPGHLEIRKKRARALYDVDKLQMLRRAHDNPFVKQLYEKFLGKPGGEVSHELLHTSYATRRRIAGESIKLYTEEADGQLNVSVCVGTSCYLKGSYDVLHGLMRRVKEKGLSDRVNLNATFCLEQCDCGPNMDVDGKTINKVTEDEIDRVFEEEILARLARS
ncbi:MAG: NADH-dependent [FeFe] hydrogenase, group A6 [Firmicutes bacterium]|jgi:NADH-quinone oxidoreductase subunit G|nr:NADH-dependent [FeFe] hydrogenase, group A6 [Bacillota bacterium]